MRPPRKAWALFHENWDWSWLTLKLRPRKGDLTRTFFSDSGRWHLLKLTIEDVTPRKKPRKAKRGGK